MKPLVIYHANCTDGLGAAYAAYTRFGDDADYVPANYGDAPPKDLAGREVYVLDFSYNASVMGRLFDNAERVVWLDHHRTAFEQHTGDADCQFYKSEVTDADDPEIILDNNKSGAMLAWEYFNPGSEIPRFIKLIDDRDRWVFQYGDDSRAFHAAFRLHAPKRPKDLVKYEFEGELNESLLTGHLLLDQQKRQVIEARTAARPCIINVSTDSGWVIARGSAVNTNVNISEVGSALAEESGTYGLVWYYNGATGRANCSLRSIGEYDVSALAKHFGGGGHKTAAGFNIDMPTLMSWLSRG